MDSGNITPLKVYTSVMSSKALIFKDNIGKSGIYRWNNLKTRDSYVASSTNLSYRLRDYLSIKYIERQLLKSNSRVYSAILKHGYSNFT
jgi:hypothetical protein